MKRVQYKIGDKVVIIGNSNSHGILIGSIQTIIGIDTLNKYRGGREYDLYIIRGLQVRDYDIKPHVETPSGEQEIEYTIY